MTALAGVRDVGSEVGLSPTELVAKVLESAAVGQDTEAACEALQQPA